jgi:glycosyltransferase involved in cell wall biosynthesis
MLMEEKLLAQLAGKDDWIDQLEKSLTEAESELERLHYKVRELEGRDREVSGALAEMTNSASYRLALKLSHVCRRIAPPGTGRRQALHMGYRGLRALSKLRNRHWVAYKAGRLLNGSRRRLGLLLHACWAEGEQFVGLMWARVHSLPDLPCFQRLDQVVASIIIPVFNHTRSDVDVVSPKKVLVIDHRIPTPDRDCGSLRMMEIMRAVLRRGHHVTLIPDDMLVFPPYLEDLQAVGIEVVYHPYYPSVRDYLDQHGREFDLVIISRADVADRHMAAVRQFAPQAKLVFDTVDLHFVREERQAQFPQANSLQPAAANRKEQELRLARGADLTLVVSPVEKALLEKECHNEIDVRIIPTIYPTSDRKPPGFEGRRGIVFIGGFDHAPNIDAVLYFAREILPRVRERIPDVLFQVIGPDPTPEVRQLASPGVQIMGLVPDVKPIFDQARVAVAPIRFGAGVKGKVNQSMSLGVPTVVTSIAAEGMYLVHERNAMIADDPESFADAVVRLSSSRPLWRRVSTNGLRSLKKHFSVEAASRQIDALLKWAGSPLPG